MAEGRYHQFCPVAMAAEILCTRWTVVILREMLAGSTRFNELRRGLPRISPALLSKRLKDLETAGIVVRLGPSGGADLHSYALTPAGEALKEIVTAFGIWGQQWVSTEASLGNLDVNLLMWDMRRNLDAKALPAQRTVIQIIFSDLSETKRNWWLIAQRGQEVDLCTVDPGQDVDLYMSTDLKTMTAIWMGHMSIAAATTSGALLLTGQREIEARMASWFGLSRFARAKRSAA